MGKLKKIIIRDKDSKISDCKKCGKEDCNYLVSILDKKGGEIIMNIHFCEDCLECEICRKKLTPLHFAFIRIDIEDNDRHKLFCSIGPCYQIKKLQE